MDYLNGYFYRSCLKYKILVLLCKLNSPSDPSENNEIKDKMLVNKIFGLERKGDK
jgi:hypothetical protein